MEDVKLGREAVAKILDRWTKTTVEQEENQARIPLKVLLGEAIDLAEVVDTYYKSGLAGGKMRLGLDSVANNGAVNTDTSTDLRELQIAVGAAQARYLVLVQQSSNAPIEKADEILDELRSALSFLLEDGEHSHGEDQLERMRDEYGEAHSHDGMAMALEGYAELAANHKDELSVVGGFNIEHINDALAVAQALRQRSADKLTGQVPQEQKDTMRLRNRLVGALIELMRNTRRTIRYVFRDYPEITKQAGSDYRRSRQRATRRKSGSGAPAANISDEVVNSERGAPQANLA